MRESQKSKLFLILIIVFSLCIIFIFYLVSRFGGAGGVVFDYAEGMQSFNSKKIVDLYFEDMLKESYESKAEMIEEFDKLFNDMRESSLKITKFDVDNNYKLYKASEYDYQKEILVKYYGIDENYISEIRGYVVTFYCVSGKEKKEVESNLIVAKIKKNWYLISTE